MGAVDDILADLPIDQLAAELDTDPATAEQAVRLTLPSLFGGLQSNVASDQGASVSLAEALTQHADSDLLEGGIDLDAIDTADGAKIVQHIYGNNPQQAAALQAAGGGAMGGLIEKLLPILAPIVLNYIASKLGVGGASGRGRAQQGDGGLGDLLGPILGGLLGGATGGGGFGQPSSQGGGQGGSGDIFGDILGQILAGGGVEAPQQSAPEQTGQEQQDSPFNAPTDEGPGEMQMPTSDDQSDEADPPRQQQGGGLGDILGQILGNGR